MPIADPTSLIQNLTDSDGLSALLDLIPVGVAIMDTRGKLLGLNKAYESLTGVNGKDALGMKCLHALRCDFCYKRCPVMTGWKDHKHKNVQANIINRSREKVFINLTLAPLLDSDGTMRGVVESIMPSSGNVFNATGNEYGLGDLIGFSPKVRKIFAMTPSIAQTDSPVLIVGETGTGKDMLAEEIHNASDREGPFIKINCGALPEHLLESELFGHVKDAFPGADHEKPGRLRMAHGGTLYISDVADMPLSLQAKLLAYMDDHVAHPMGATRGVRTDVRIMAASSSNLEELVSQRLFRQDLLYRLNVIRLHLPPLRERGDDLHLLKDHFLKIYQGRSGKRLNGFTRNVDNLLQSYSFPGNIRELRNIIEYAVNFCDTRVIRMRHLPGYILHAPTLPEPLTSPLQERSQMQDTAPPVAQETWEDVQRKMILEALVKTGGKKKQAAELLGWGRSTLWRKMKQFGID